MDAKESACVKQGMLLEKNEETEHRSFECADLEGGEGKGVK